MARPLDRLKRRSDFLAVAGSRQRWATPGFVLQAAPRRDAAAGAAALCVGFTASRKVGNAVQRNRAKRRLRALADAMLPVYATPGRDYVMIARAGLVGRRHSDLRRDLLSALKQLDLLQQQDGADTAKP